MSGWQRYYAVFTYASGHRDMTSGEQANAMFLYMYNAAESRVNRDTGEPTNRVFFDALQLERGGRPTRWAEDAILTVDYKDDSGPSTLDGRSSFPTW